MSSAASPFCGNDRLDVALLVGPTSPTSAGGYQRSPRRVGAPPAACGSGTRRTPPARPTPP